MEYWNKIDKKLKNLKLYKNRQEWNRFFNAIEEIRNSDNILKHQKDLSKTDIFINEYTIKAFINNLDTVEVEFMNKTNKGDNLAYEAVYKIVDMLCNEFLFKDLKISEFERQEFEEFLMNLPDNV